MTNSSQPTSSASQQYRSYGPQWQGYDLHQRGYGRSEMIPPAQFPGQGPSSLGAPRVPPVPPGIHPLNQPTSSSSTPPPQPPSGAPGRHHISLQTKRFEPPAEPRKTDVAGIAELPPLLERSCNKYDAADESDDSSDLGGAESNPPISLKQTEFSLMQFAKRRGGPTTVHSTSGRKYGWRGFSRRSISPLSGGRTD